MIGPLTSAAATSLQRQGLTARYVGAVMSTLIGDEVLIEVLSRLQREPLPNGVGIVVEGRGGFYFQSPAEVREWMGDPDFPTTEEQGVARMLCRVGYQLASRGDITAFAVVARRGLNRWEVFHLRPAPGGQVHWGNKELAWDGLDPVTEVEAERLSLRDGARLTESEAISGVISIEKSFARGRLRDVLIALADAYEASGQQATKDAVVRELGPLLVGGLSVRNAGDRDLREWRR